MSSQGPSLKQGTAIGGNLPGYRRVPKKDRMQISDLLSVYWEYVDTSMYI